MNPPIVMGLAAATAITFVLAVYQILADLFLRDRSRVSERVDYEFLKKKSEKAKRSPLFKNLDQMSADALRDEGQPTIQQQFVAMIEQSGLDTTPNQILAIAGALACLFGALGLLLVGNAVSTILAGGIGGVLPIWYVRQKRDARIEKLRSQLSDAFELMARVVRAGQTLGQAFLAVADEFPLPISAEFGYCYEQQNLGLSPEVTLRDLTRRTGVIELRIFVLAVLVQQQTGGNLAEILSKLAGVVRERYQIRGTIQALTAEGRMQGWILTALPLAMLLLLLAINPSYGRIHFQHLDLLAATFGLELFGVLWIRKIVNFEF
ncbi:type II secretion system F family protein [Singulisphaera sp. PoT]|uniref:type II secretion system F family protein n=1 Tax=Singulisphaera sp. PoT TaxID=3411797 RepID=UPI003BF55E73